MAAQFDQFENYLGKHESNGDDMFRPVFAQQHGSGNQNQPMLNEDPDLTTSETEELRRQRLMNDLKQVQERQISHGIPAFGDLFQPSLINIEASLNSGQFMLEQREIEINFRREVRLKLLKHEEQQRISDNKLDKERLRNENLKKKLAEMEASHKHQMKSWTEEQRRVTSERDDLYKSVVKLTNKEAQYRHELKNKEKQNEKL